jgi:hypothetical protein
LLLWNLSPDTEVSDLFSNLACGWFLDDTVDDWLWKRFFVRIRPGWSWDYLLDVSTQESEIILDVLFSDVSLTISDLLSNFRLILCLSFLAIFLLLLTLFSLRLSTILGLLLFLVTGGWRCLGV